MAVHFMAALTGTLIYKSRWGGSKFNYCR